MKLAAKTIVLRIGQSLNLTDLLEIYILKIEGDFSA